ncbi:GLUG motif-containing protein [Paenibacillus macquariensis]|uniref:GLUG domain-containing protein n=1 Tax=Paenibacillus macquariensis TaxID=948756 RepID=A0ABY1JVU2_9BACL|nr:GLUG motif-containing protein [Paenibacillus macquariensis]MEC0090699.1 hypothetical protein [Paenibacillus macquariensis]OAB34450.1 hypothetical protein PMSM_11295 [Paenibacillus macquariensis subsp. macquariensis]SIQ85920.1 hypothetical protein SAMN05421578_104373 [Paenibacillus macquariensis]
MQKRNTQSMEGITIKGGVLTPGNHTINETATNYYDAVVNQSMGHVYTGEGEGSRCHPYLIATAAQLNEVRYHLEVGNYYKLTADIDLSGYTACDSWLPIGDINNKFQGNMDGNGFTITNLTINRPNSGYIGLFGYTGSRSSISNLALENTDVDGYYDVGGLVGNNNGTINNCYTMGITRGGYCNIGGLVGNNNGLISNSYSTGNVSGMFYTGGLVGLNAGLISSSYTTGNVEGTSKVGGLVGSNEQGTINNSFYDTETTGQSDTE